MRGHRHRSLPLPRIVFALLAALALAAGTTEVHSSPADHLAGRSLGAAVAEGASHPNESRHVESSETRVHPPCPACLLQLQTAAAGLAAPTPLPAPASVGIPTGPATPARRSALPRPGSPRAPPAPPVS